MSAFGKRRLAGQLRASEKRRLKAQRDQILSPYESVKFRIDDLLVQIDSAKAQIQAFSDRTKAEALAERKALRTEKTVTNVTAQRSCPRCGASLDETARFCSACGHPLSA